MVIIPVGGKATRLLPLTAETSKACLRLLNRPMIEFSLLSLARQGIRNFIFGVKGYTNYRDLHDYFESGYGFSARYGITPRVHVKYQPNVDDLGSADSARINIEYYNVRDPVFAVQGDNIFDVNLKELIEFHREKDAVITIALREVEDVEGYGIADISKDHRILRFVEKPAPKEAPSNLANTGLYMVSPEIRKIFKEKGVKKLMKERKRLDFGYDFIPYVIESGRPVYGYVLKGSWYDVGTPKRYLEAVKDMLEGRFSSLKDFGGRIEGESRIWVQGESFESMKRRKEIVKKIQQGQIEVEGSVLIGRHCEIGDGVRIVNSCIDNYTRIEDGVVIENSAIMDRVIIEEKAEIKDSIIGRHVTVCSSAKKPTKISAVSVIADDVTIAEGCALKSTKIYPHQYVKGEFANQTIMPG
ncbi:MAG: NDP-sugar synthase [Candidatus Bathyarchaeota archaeon]|jgi:NDP-sugar pyrophosphorylase family protein|nr:NDP-sugar synthase [Candidatus Bathyarchaeota archaeon A05DMB-3]MDH7606359.1 NDP-sugar synthase [Candidatus Bathyarchaeota archaeon]